jgi:hypothetical protein
VIVGVRDRINGKLKPRFLPDRHGQWFHHVALIGCSDGSIERCE